jgi:hypothetical protein
VSGSANVVGKGALVTVTAGVGTFAATANAQGVAALISIAAGVGVANGAGAEIRGTVALGQKSPTVAIVDKGAYSLALGQQSPSASVADRSAHSVVLAQKSSTVTEGDV